MFSADCAIIGVTRCKLMQVGSDGVKQKLRWGAYSLVLIGALHALLIGCGVGLIAVGFARFTSLAQQGFARLALWPGGVVWTPVLGALFCLLIGLALIQGAAGHGVPDVMAGIAFRGGVLPVRVPLVRGFLATVAIGSGLSVGPEGPIVQIGAVLGSWYGQKLRLTRTQLKTLAACGAASGIAVIFNAPVAGVFFALEALLFELRTEALVQVVLAAVAASMVGRMFFGDHPAFLVPHSELVHPLELGFQLGLGGLAALVGVAFIRGLYAFEEGFHRLPIPRWLKPLLGALGVGVLGSLLPAVLGSGHGVIEETLYMQLPWRVLVLLVPLKILATALSLGSGNPGGIFAPSLVIGAALGGSLGYLVHGLWPQVTAAPPSYALVGMAALLTATVRAPIAAIFLIFEMTRDYNLMLPLMAATMLALLVAQALEPESIYTLALKRQDIDLRAARDFDVMREILVGDVMTPLAELVTVTPEMSLTELKVLFEQTHHHGLPVVEDGNQLYGVVTWQDVEKALQAGRHQARVGEICTRQVRVTFPDETLADALRYLADFDIGRIPVVRRTQPRQLVGMLRRGDVLRAYACAAYDWQRRQHLVEQKYLEENSPWALHRLVLQAGDAACQRRVSELSLPPQVLLVAIERGTQLLLPRGETVLLPGDEVLALTTLENGRMVEKVLRQGTL